MIMKKSFCQGVDFIIRKSLQSPFHCFLIFVFTCFLLFNACTSIKQTTPQPTTKQHLDPVYQIIDSVKRKFAPDPRTSIFDITPEINNNKLILNGETLSKSAVKELILHLTELNKFEIENNINELPDLSLGKDTCAVVTISVASLHCEPDIRQEVVNQVLLGAAIRLLKRKRSNYYCQLEDGYLGWIDGSALAVVDSAMLSDWQNQRKVVVKAIWGLIKCEPSESSASVGDLVVGNELIFLSKDEKWSRVKLPDGRTGYVNNEFLIDQRELLNRKAPSAENILNTAGQLKGFPYVWGGTSTKGMDCSGFTYTVFRINGIRLPRDANMQVTLGDSVEITENLEKLLPADLLFFSPDSNRITHVGIYLGDYQFIHSEGYVRQDSFNPADSNYYEYRRRTLLKVRRIIK